MKSAFRIILAVMAFLVIIPAIAGIVITLLWNAILPSVCGFAAITFLQGVGMFYLGMFITVGAFYMGIILIGTTMHMMTPHRMAWRKNWHNMTDEQRREFIMHRREHFNFYHRHHSDENTDE